MINVINTSTINKYNPYEFQTDLCKLFRANAKENTHEEGNLLHATECPAFSVTRLNIFGILKSFLAVPKRTGELTH